MKSLRAKPKEPTIFTKSRLDAIALLIELDGIAPTERFPHLPLDGKRIRTWAEAEEWCAERADRSVRTIRRIFATFKKGGQAALQRRKRADKGISRFFARHSKAAMFAAYLRLAGLLTSRAIHRAMLRNHELLEIPEGKTASYETVRAWIKSKPSAFVELALEGQKRYRDRMSSLLAGGKDGSV